MNMKGHILAALKEQFDGWEYLLSGLSDAVIITPYFDLDWSVKDVVAHLWAWQQITIARVQGGLDNRDPEYPKWIVEFIENWEEDADRVNALTFETQHVKSWPEIYGKWKAGFQQLLEVGEKISERNLLDGDRYPWLQGHNLAAILIATYDHHQEHYEKILDWLQRANPG